MKRKFLLIYIVFLNTLFININYISAQTNDKPSLEKGTLDSQFNFLISSSSRYEDFKVVKEGLLYVMKAHMNDSIKLLHSTLNSHLKTISLKDTLIDSLKNQLALTNDKYGMVYREKNSLRFLGILMSKSAYNSLTWIIIISLAGLLVLIFFVFKKNIVTYNQTKLDLDQLKSEFEDYRKKALLREEKLARQHLNELNKYRGQ